MNFFDLVFPDKNPSSPFALRRKEVIHREITQEGVSEKALAFIWNISEARVHQLFIKAEREITLGRSLDMGGPRDIWLSYGVPDDPRLDNFYPISVMETCC